MMTPLEREVVELLAAAWNKYLELPWERVADNVEFQTHIHNAQRQVMARCVRRDLNNESQ